MRSAPCPPNSLLPLLFSPLLLMAVFARAQQHPYAQGNLALVFQPRSGRATAHSPTANLSALWCQATVDGKERLHIASAKFVRVLPHPVTNYDASLNEAGNRAYLMFSPNVTVSAIGKYRCEITTREGDHVTGNMFVYMRPILFYNASVRLDQIEQSDMFAWVGPSQKASLDSEAVLHCPAIGYPLPELRWFKDGKPINSSAKVPSLSNGGSHRKYLLKPHTLHIRALEDADEGMYKCVATNRFPEDGIDAPHREYSLTLDQHLRVSSALSWLLPLLIIVACLILLVLTIWSCSQWKKYKVRQYNVAQKEKEFGQKNIEDQKLALEQDDVE